MLIELDIRDFAIIDHLRLRLTPGFNVLTGETGAGKSIIVDAVGQLLGERADTTFVRTDAERAVVEGVFEPGMAAAPVADILAEYGIDAESVLILSREITLAGRSTARVNGRPVPVKVLAELGQHLVDIHGQSESASLKREAEHVELLDRYAGLSSERRTLARQVSEAHAMARELAELRASEDAMARRAEDLAFAVDEIEAARLVPDEEAGLLAERIRLANAEKLAQLAGTAYAALRGEAERVGFESGGSETGALDALDATVRALEALGQIDPALDAVRESAVSVRETLEDGARELLAYLDRLEFQPDRLEEVEERLGLMAGLKRKYGTDIPAVLAYAETAAAELARITGAGERVEALQAEHQAALRAIGELAGHVSNCRREAGLQLAKAVESELVALGMPGSRFEVSLQRREDQHGVPVDGTTYAFDAKGIDHVAFLVSANPGEPPRPLVRVASGGETARLMLALKSILSQADEVPTLIFDEIDTGVGGRIGAVVGEKLWGLADRHQVLCVTHLAQVAIYGDTHYHVRKLVLDGRTRTDVDHLAEEARAQEVMHMLGGGTDLAQANAWQQLQQAAAWKLGRRQGAPGD